MSTVSSKVFSSNFSAIQFWDVRSAYLSLVNHCAWEKTPLGLLVTIRNDEATKDEIEKGAVLLLDRISFDEGKVYSGKKTATRMKQFKGYFGDIVVSKINARKGAIGIVEGNDTIGSTIHFRTLIPNNKKIDTKFLWLALRSSFCRNQFVILTGGQGKGEISETNLLSVEVPYPSLPVQQKIVGYWEKGNINANKHAELSHNISDSIPDYLVLEIGLKPLKQAHSRRSFVSFWKEIDRWGVNLAREMTCQPNLSKSPFPVVSLSEVISDLQNGWSPKCLGRKVEGDEWGVLKVGAVSFGWFDERQNKALPPNLTPREQYEVKPGDLIISRANITQYVGACALVGKVRPKLMLCDKLFRVIWKQDSTVLPEYLNEILKIPHLRWQIENNLTGASPTMKNISKPALMALQFPLPPLSVQEKIIKIIESKRVESRALLQKASDNRKTLVKKVEKFILGTLSVEDF